MTQPGMGRSVRRTEDQRFITGTGTYTNDIATAGEQHLVFLRSPVPHGDIVKLDVTAANAHPQVQSVLTCADLDAAGLPDPTPAPLPNNDPSTPLLCQPPLARKTVRYVGEPIAAVIASSISAARDAAELIDLEIQERPAIASLAQALAGEAQDIWPQAPGNVVGTIKCGDLKATDAAIAQAAHVVELSLINNRLAAVSMEPRGAIATFDPSSERLNVTMGSQGVHGLRDKFALLFSLPTAQVRVVTPDTGGGFGTRMFMHGEPIVVAFAARQLGTTVNWQCERSEAFMGDLQARDHLSHATLALDADHRFIALKVNTHSNIGAYMSDFGGLIAWFGSSVATGAYDIPVAYVQIQAVVTNSTPVDAYRGAGRPEAAYVIERLVGHAARQLDVPAPELRRANFIAPQTFPYTNAMGTSYDSGNYAHVMDAGLKRADWHSFETRRASDAARGVLRGIGMAYYVEVCASFGGETTHLTVLPDGTVEALVGTQSTGQGHETSFAQLISARLGLKPDTVRVRQGDSQLIPTGGGTGGSRTLAIAGSSLALTTQAMIESGKHLAAQLLEAGVHDIVYQPGAYQVTGTDHRVTLAEVVHASYNTTALPAGVRAGLASSERFDASGGTFPNGCHVCEVQVDPQTGVVRIVRYTIDDDMGRVVNPLLLEGQIVGGAAQGISQALYEHMVYDEDSGQLLTGSFMDYNLVHADTMPRIDFAYHEVPSERNVLQVKGAGEAGTVGSPPAVVNAVLDALAPHGVQHMDMPLTPLRVWQAIQRALSK